MIYFVSYLLDVVSNFNHVQVGVFWSENYYRKQNLIDHLLNMWNGTVALLRTFRAYDSFGLYLFYTRKIYYWLFKQFCAKYLNLYLKPIGLNWALTETKQYNTLFRINWSCRFFTQKPFSTFWKIRNTAPRSKARKS